MRIFLFEFLTGGGWFLIDEAQSPPGSLLREGQAMIDAVAEDFAAIEGVEVVRFRDARLGNHEQITSRSAPAALAPTGRGIPRESLPGAAPPATRCWPSRPGPAALPLASREAATSCSPGRQPGEPVRNDFQSPEGATAKRDTQPQRIAIQDPADLQLQFKNVALESDFTLVIAPEFNSHLAAFAERVIDAGGKLTSPSPDYIRLAGDKHRTANWLRKRSIPAPQGILLAPGEAVSDGFPFPAVLKPIDGAGSLDVRRIDGVAQLTMTERAATMRLESFYGGTPVSVAAICGPLGFTLLPPCLQKLSRDGNFTYLGGECPIDVTLAKRASRLAKRAFEAMPTTTGYVGIDMILGENDNGSNDVVIEVNPRLTTSYVGLREVINRNLAEAMILAASGKPVELSTKAGRVEFSASGSVRFQQE